MSASDHLGPQWSQPELTFQVHRGLTRKPQTGRWLGMHWSADPAVARRFAGPFGHVVHADVPMSSVETDTHTLQRERVNPPEAERVLNSPEKEVPAIIGQPVKVTGITGPQADVNTGAWNGRRNEGSPSAMGAKRPARKRTYKKPREMTA